jgi:hypothetical protein
MLNVGVVAVVAPFDHTPHRGCPAGLDGPHQTELVQRQIVGLPVGGAVES